MLYLEDDMDDLFRRAADQYPLQTDTKDWGGLATSFAEPDNSTKTNPKFNPAFIFASILMLLVLVGSGLLVNYNHTGSISTKKINTVNSIATSAKQLGIDIIPAKKEIVPENLAPYGSHNIILHKNQVAIRDIQLFENESSSYNKIEQHNQNWQLQKDPLPGWEENIQPEVTVINKLDASGTDFTSNIMVMPNLKMVSGKLTPAQQPKVNSLSKIKSFYADIIGGIQMNQVAGQGFSKPGFILGLNGGYRINRSFGVELGILYSSKHYFSRGQYFDIGKAGTSMPANMKIINLQGSSQLIEIPIGLRYNFNHSKYKLFITSGVSSFLLTREQNNYLALIGGVEQNMNGMYHHKTAYIASAINFSMGTEFTFGKKQTRLKIEPFLEVPVKGMGVGLMSVTGAGIRIGIGLPHH
jgi:hypothetical protein